MTWKEEPDRIVLYAEVAWRCHECRKKVERENLHWHGERLLCVECIPDKGD